MSVKIVAFCCSHSAYQAANKALADGHGIPDGLEIVRVPCSGRVDVLHLTRAFENGADAVLVFGCQEDACQDITGNVRARNRVEYARGLLKDIGIEPERLQMYNVTANMAPKFVQITSEVATQIESLGPSPVRKG